MLNRKHTKALTTALCVCVIVLCHTRSPAQTPTEADALAAIKRATNPTTKLAAAEDFVAQFPNSSSRFSVAELVAGEILKSRNGAVAVALLDRSRAVFTTQQERELFKPVALEAYALANRADDAFMLASELLERNPDDLRVLALMTQLGAEETRRKNRKYADVALQYGLKAIALVEAGTKPAKIDEETWSFQKLNLAQLYQQTAILYLAAGNTPEATARLTKATALAPFDPANFALLGRVVNAEYVSEMTAYEAMPDGKAKQDALRRLETILDSVIDNYARAAGLAAGRVEYQLLLQQVIPDLTSYYKYRHNNSIKGLQQLIAKYRPVQ